MILLSVYSLRNTIRYKSSYDVTNIHSITLPKGLNQTVVTPKELQLDLTLFKEEELVQSEQTPNYYPVVIVLEPIKSIPSKSSTLLSRKERNRHFNDFKNSQRTNSFLCGVMLTLIFHIQFMGFIGRITNVSSNEKKQISAQITMAILNKSTEKSSYEIKPIKQKIMVFSIDTRFPSFSLSLCSHKRLCCYIDNFLTLSSLWI
jgi:hypothetical protein